MHLLISSLDRVDLRIAVPRKKNATDPAARKDLFDVCDATRLVRDAVKSL
jgi:hypothetical protein